MSCLTFVLILTSHARVLDNLNISLKEFQTILLFLKLPARMKEVFKRDLKDEWLNFEAFLDKLTVEIENMRLSGGDELKPTTSPLSSIASFKVKQSRPPKCFLCKNSNHSWIYCKS